MPFGINDLKNVIRIPVNWDLAYMRQFQTADGVTWDRVVSRLGAALTLFNRGLTRGELAPFFRTTTDLGVEYRVGHEGGELPPMPEHNRPDLFTGEESGHMIPMRDYGGGLGWTSLALRRATAARLDSQVAAIIDRAGNTFTNRLLERLFYMNETRVGAAGVSLPFADGGASDAEYAPVSWGGYNFDTTHNHYFRLTDDATGRTAFLNQGSATIREHGHPSPFILVVPEVDVDLWVAQPEFTSPERAALLTAGLERRAIVPDTDTYIGLWETARSWGYIMPTSRLPANYAGMFKLYGHGNSRSPLVVRYERGYPFGLSIEGQVIIYPLQEAVTMLTFGAGVNDRTNGALVKFAGAGDYTNPVLNS
jgi:hypothetical protein